ncbi:universal stress protein [Lutibacter citreus]|uniref:universal stress protein n=1 Tax=Lutibacter citreus TaxID=2138210 RepID=UPI000DBE3969|nr:universal stress protein [Lutibacter citreus]
MRNILIPTDFSDNSWNAIKYGLNYFVNTECTFYLLHVTMYSYLINEDTAITSGIKIDETLINKSKVDLEKLLEKVKNIDKNKNHHFKLLNSYNFFIDAVKSQIKENNIDFIVMGTKGASGLSEIIIGSNTADLITQVKCPVLIVPENSKYKIPREIAFPTDYNIYYNPDILLEILNLAKRNLSSLRILHVGRKGEELTDFQIENKEFLSNFFANENHSFHFITNKKIEQGIQCFVESRDVDMIVMIAKNINLFQRILFKPTVEDISYHTEIPFLVLHE